MARPVDDSVAHLLRELTPQVWSVEQPWFAERLAALQQKISSR